MKNPSIFYASAMPVLTRLEMVNHEIRLTTVTEQKWRKKADWVFQTECFARGLTRNDRGTLCPCLFPPRR
jgi:hypothetical protein